MKKLDSKSEISCGKRHSLHWNMCCACTKISSFKTWTEQDPERQQNIHYLMHTYMIKGRLNLRSNMKSQKSRVESAAHRTKSCAACAQRYHHSSHGQTRDQAPIKHLPQIMYIYMIKGRLILLPDNINIRSLRILKSNKTGFFF